MYDVEWLAPDGTVLAQSDSRDREKFLTFVGRHRVPRIASHWAYLMHPLVQDQTGSPGTIRYRQIEYYRMPVMGFLGMENARALARQRLGEARARHRRRRTGTTLLAHYVADFEKQYCYDRYWTEGGDGSDGRNTRYLCCGHG